MAILNEYELHRLAVMAGIDSHATIENKQSLLIALDVLKPQGNLSDQEYAAQVSQTLNKTLDAQYSSPLGAVCVLRKEREKEIEFVVPAGKENEELKWTVNEENGNVQTGSVKMADTYVKTDDEGKPMIREINGVKYEKRAFKMPADFDIGYHKLEMEIPGQPKASTQMIYAPTKCYDPINIKDGGLLILSSHWKR